jgi:hypothetical protein
VITTLERWDGCYDAGWRDLIVPAAFAHPAKMARGLVARIFEELFARGLLAKGDTVVDPFGGIGTTAIEGASRGVTVICCELEPKFVALARENLARHARDWETMGRPTPVVVQGDSRQLRQHVGPVLAAALVSSPPYATDQNHDRNGVDLTKLATGQRPAGWNSQARSTAGYGSSDGQLGTMPEGEVDAVISSPPYVSGGHHPDQTGAWNTNDRGQGGTKDAAGYGREDGQLGHMPEGSVDAVVSSPPYAEAKAHPSLGHPEAGGLVGGDILGRATTGAQRGDERYGETRGQLGALPPGEVDAVIGSPPYAEIASGAGGLNTKPATNGQQGGRSPSSASQDTDQRYGDSAGQLARLPAGDVDAVVSSPPFLDARSTQTDKGSIKGSTPTAHDPEAMGVSAGNLQAMRAGDVDAIVSSPPFTQGYAGGGGINVKGYGADGADKVGARTYQGTGAERVAGNLEALPLGDVDAVVSSPPWGDNTEGAFGAHKFKTPEHGLQAGRGHGASDAARLRQLERDREKTYGDSAGQLAAMPMEDVDAVVSSPPYEGSLSASEDGIDWQKANSEETPRHQLKGQSAAPSYPTNGDNIGNATGETFWSAAHQIVTESFAILKPGGTAVWVVKAFVRDKKVVDFPGDWRKLCERVGFETLCEIHASLVAEETKSHLFDGEVTTRRERKSFFRRLAEKKGSPPIDYETVYFMRKPEGA